MPGDTGARELSRFSQKDRKMNDVLDELSIQALPKYAFTFGWKRYQSIIASIMIVMSALHPLVKRV